MSAILVRIERAISEFIADEGRRPNVLMVGPQVECELDALNLTRGDVVHNLRIVPDDDEADFSVAYKKPRG